MASLAFPLCAGPGGVRMVTDSLDLSHFPIMRLPSSLSSLLAVEPELHHVEIEIDERYVSQRYGKKDTSTKQTSLSHTKIQSIHKVYIRFPPPIFWGVHHGSVDSHSTTLRAAIGKPGIAETGLFAFKESENKSDQQIPKVEAKRSRRAGSTTEKRSTHFRFACKRPS
jgi:hypothetical protein